MRCLCLLLLFTISRVKTDATQASMEKPDFILINNVLATNNRLTALCVMDGSPGKVTCTLYVGNTSVTTETTTGNTCEFEVTRRQLDEDTGNFKTLQLSCDYQTNQETGGQLSPRSDPKEVLLLGPLEKAILRVTPRSTSLKKTIRVSCEVKGSHAGVKCQLYGDKIPLKDGRCSWNMTWGELMRWTGPGQVLLTCDYTLDVWKRFPEAEGHFERRSNSVTVTVINRRKPGQQRRTTQAVKEKRPEDLGHVI
ncbi:uncharacterized protein LOC114666939 [Erpetoichthys calabaricus]|uniref:uncharacterized protein LOC114666939 n=1 Tax=Erpetoichthys calabaricus TaxID=27687 RepID=UPI0010A098CF|nr:uncharacterized protein LOC114666939 [Erpetoichthys calabaricus]